jgi:hypothetical protein
MALAARNVQALDTEVSTRAALWSSSRDLDDKAWLTPIQLWMRVSDAHAFEHGGLRFFAEVWGEVDPTRTTDRFDSHVREAYAQWSTGPFELRAGYQSFAWGRADGINPTDNLTPKQLTLLTRETEEQRFGTPALSASWFSGALSLNVIWLAGTEHSELPWPHDAPPLVHVGRDDPMAQIAARVQVVRSDIEGSLSYFNGYDVLPTQSMLSSTGIASALVTHERLEIIGGDLAKTAGRFVLRAEIAHLQPPKARDGAAFVKRKQWHVVIGGERTFGEYLNLNLQYYHRSVAGDAVMPGLTPAEENLGVAFAIAAQQYDRRDGGITYRLSDQWLDQTLEASVSGLVSLRRKGYLVRPLLKYRASDNWSLSVGGEILGGDGKSAFGFLHRNTTFFAEIRRGF